MRKRFFLSSLSHSSTLPSPFLPRFLSLLTDHRHGKPDKIESHQNPANYQPLLSVICMSTEASWRGGNSTQLKSNYSSSVRLSASLSVCLSVCLSAWGQVKRTKAEWTWPRKKRQRRDPSKFQSRPPYQSQKQNKH